MKVFDSLIAIFKPRPPREVTQPPPRSTIRPRDVVLRDAAFLVRRHLADLPTSRRKSGLPERAWQRAMLLCRSAELVNANGVWRIQDYPTALTKLQRANKGRADLVRSGNFVSPYPDDW